MMKEFAMQYIVTASQMKQLEVHTIQEIGIPSIVLMERAALAIFEEIYNRYPPTSVLIAIGPGNNGADGLALARLLAVNGYEVSIYLTNNIHQKTKEYILQE